MKAYIVRIQKDGKGNFGGHVSDPETQQRMPFRNAEELWQLLCTGALELKQLVKEQHDESTSERKA